MSLQRKLVLVLLMLGVLALHRTELRAQWMPTNLNVGGTSSFATMGSYLFVVASGSIYKSSDEGNSWSSGGQIPSDADPNQLLAVGSDLFLTTSYYQVVRSTDTGKSWRQCKNSGMLAWGAGAIIAFGDTLLINTAGTGVLRSVDSAGSWTMTNWFAGDSSVGQFVIDGKYLFAGLGKGGVGISSDNGKTWRVTDIPWLRGLEINAVAAKGPLVLAASWGAGIVRSTDYGVTWDLANTGIPLRDARALIFVGDTIFAGFNHGGGIFRSTDNGLTWQDANYGLADRGVFSFMVHDSYLFAGTIGPNNVWRRPLNDFGKSAVQQLPKTEFSLDPAYPNPFSDHTTIGFTLANSTTVTLTLTDVSGRETVLIDGQRMDAGHHDVRWDAKEVLSGVYQVRLRANTNTFTARIAVMK